MSSHDKVIELMNLHNGILTSKIANEAGIDNKTLQRLHNSNGIERIGHGLYINPIYLEDDYYMAQYRCKSGVFSHETALFFHELIDRTPFQIMMTIPSGYNTRLLKDKEKYKFFYVTKKLHELGRIQIKTPYGNAVFVYDRERTICDTLKKKAQLDTDLVLEAVKRYMKSPSADFVKLLYYAELFNIRQEVRQYMEVLT